VSHLPPPPVDPRAYGDFVRETEALLRRYTEWAPAADDPAGALVRVFARMAERVADRLNRVPDRSFLAFLDLIGVDPRPPQPARVPLTFSLAAGARTDAVVPARAAVAGQPLEGEKEPVVFETERELVVTRTTLEAVVVHDPARDRWSDRTAAAAAGTGFAAFAGDTPLTHRLHLAHRAFGSEGSKTVRIRVTPAQEPGGAPSAPWPSRLEWSWRDPSGEHALAPAANPAGAPWEVLFTDLPAVPLSTVAGVEGAWITARLRPALRQRGVAPEAVLAAGAWVESGETFLPFGRTEAPGDFALSLPEEVAERGAVATLEIELDGGFPAPVPDAGLQLHWEYRVGESWIGLGVSAPGSASVGDETAGFSDGTHALTRGGVVSFRVPAGWAPSLLQGKWGRWMRARVAEGDYAGASGFRPPSVRRLALGYDLPVPPVSVEVRAELSGTDLLPAAGAFGGAPVDVSKDFLPFGERPRQGDVFHLALPQLRGQAGAAVTLGITINPFPSDAPAAGTQPVLRWEFWSAAAGRWLPFGESRATNPAVLGYGFVDRTASLTAATGVETTVTFTAPALDEVDVNGRRDSWIRVRIAEGDYGRETRLTKKPDGTTQLQPATYRPPSVRAARLDYARAEDWSAPFAAVPENDGTFTPRVREGTILTPFAPFTLPADGRPSLYLGFRRAGEATGFANRAATLYLGVAPALFGDAERAVPAEPAALAWWYWNGAEWARLGVMDETAALTRRGLVTFIGPADLAASSRFGREAFWLRVTVEGGGWPQPPRLERVLLNTVWAEHAVAVGGEVLGSGSGRPGQRVRTVRAPVLPGERIEVREAELPSPAEREALEREGGPGAVSADSAGGGAWVRWTAVPDFHGSGPGSRHYVVDRLTGELRFGDGRHGRVPPPGRGNVRAAFYRTGGGPAGNRPAGNLTRLKTPIASVDRVTNPEPAAGGAAAESLESVRVRGPRTLRHRDRAVAAADLEDLAMEASPEVALARAVPPQDEREAGRVRVLVVPRGAAARPVPSVELLDRVEAHLAERLPAGVEVEVLGPEWMEVGVTVEVVPAGLEDAAQVQAVLPGRLADFLHPVTGGASGEGWSFGRRPHRSDLYAVVEAVPGVDHVRRLEVHEGSIPRTPFFLVHSGTHVVRVAGSTDG
jgi:predicted phage baseplate assembly protein